MTEWTADRLEALPEGAVIDAEFPPVHIRMVRIMSSPSSWVSLTGVLQTSEVVAAVSGGSIRVVSVPVDALLADEALNAWRSLPIRPDDHYTRTIMRGAIAHITGEES